MGRGEHIVFKAPNKDGTGYRPTEEGLDAGKYMEEKEEKLRNQVIRINCFC